MPDQLILEAAKPFLDYGLLGAIVLFFGWYIVTQNKVHKAEMKEERESHERTRLAHIKAMEEVFGMAAEVKEAVRAVSEMGTQWISLAKAVIQRDSRE